MEDRIPKPNTQFLSWFFGEYRKGTLRLTPRYQRNPIWSIGQKCFLIDSLISGCPIPQVYINVLNEGAGVNRKTIYEVVDGQQRLRAILEFMEDEYKLIATTARSYPVSEKYKPHIGKRYSELPPNFQDMIWNYPLAVQELRGWSEIEIRALFRRLNYVVEKLNNQELRHSQYFGEFVTAVENLARKDFWDQIRLFSRRDSQRMLDIEFVSELFVMLIDGPQHLQKTLDRFYAQYDVEFPKKKFYLNKFDAVLESLNTISDFITNTRFSKKGDFYGLFGATCQLVKSNLAVVNMQRSRSELNRLHQKLEGDVDELTGMPARYYSTVIEGPNKVGKRKERIEILTNILNNNL